MTSNRPTKFRPYRTGMLVLFFVLAGVPTILFFRSVIATLATGRAQTVALDSTAPGGLPRACAVRAETLRRELSDHFDGLRAMASSQGSAGLRRWQAFTVDFGARVDAARTECTAEPTTGTGPLFDELDELARIANSVATPLMTDNGDSLARIERVFAAARKPPAAD